MSVIIRQQLAGVSAAALSRFAASAQREAGTAGEIDILITSSKELQELNRQFRGKNKPTDVLSFPSLTQPGGGDIAISFEIAADNAARLGHSLAEELKVLILHGTLHLAGQDHESDDGEMERLERELRLKLRLPSSLIERVQPGKRAANSRRSRVVVE